MRGLAWQVHRFAQWVTYRVKLGLLAVFGPATLDWEHDPIEQLKRERLAQLERDRHIWVMH